MGILFRIIAAWCSETCPVRTARLASRRNPPGIPDWEITAAARLLDLVPEYRQHAAVRRHPVILAFIARHLIAGAVQGARQGYRATRSELGDLVPPHAIDAALRAWRAEGERLAATACAVDLVERAQRGETFRPRLLHSCLQVQLELRAAVACCCGYAT
jgi:hypothetical protein